VALRVSSWLSLPCKVLSRPIIPYSSSSIREGGNNNNVHVGGKSDICGWSKLAIYHVVKNAWVVLLSAKFGTIFVPHLLSDFCLAIVLSHQV
jgi:hypothetical protein